MPGIAGNPHHIYDRHVRISQEAAFGEVNGAADWQAVPILGDGFKLKGSSPRFFPETNLASYRRMAIAHQLVVEGALTTLAWVDFIDYLLAMALTRDANGDLYSYTFDHYTPTDPRRLLGAVAESLTLRVTGTGDADVQVELALRAKLEAENDALDTGDFDYSSLVCVPFAFRDARIEIDTVHVTDVEAWTLTVNNAVSQGPMIRTAGTDFGTVAYLVAGRREISLDLTDVDNDARFNEAIRSGDPLSFTADFFHPLGHLLQIQLPLLAVEESDESASQADPTKRAPRLQAIVPCEGGDEICWALDRGPTTTTLEPLSTTPAPTTTTTAAATTTPGE